MNHNQSHDEQSSGTQSQGGCCSMQNVGSAERTFSAVLGGLCLGHSLWGRTIPRPVSMLMGAGLIWRAVTGYCALYDSLGMSTADPETHGPSALAYQHSSPRAVGATGDAGLAATGEGFSQETMSRKLRPGASQN